MIDTSHNHKNTQISTTKNTVSLTVSLETLRMTLLILTLSLFICGSLCVPARSASWAEKAGSGVLELFEGNDASQNMVCTLLWADQVEMSHTKLKNFILSLGP